MPLQSSCLNKLRVAASARNVSNEKINTMQQLLHALIETLFVRLPIQFKLLNFLGVSSLDL